MNKKIVEQIETMRDAYIANAHRVNEDDVMAALANGTTSFTLGLMGEDFRDPQVFRVAFIMFMMGYTASEENWVANWE